MMMRGTDSWLFYGKCSHDKVFGIFVTTSNFSNNTRDEFEREDNTADTKILNKLNWSVKTDLYNYIKENKNVN